MSHESEKCRSLAQYSIRNFQIRYKKTYDDKHREVYFNIVDLVLIFKPVSKHGLTKKFLHRWNGPYRIIEILRPKTYQVLNLQGRKQKELVHVSRMKPFKSRVVTDPTNNMVNETTNEITDEISYEMTDGTSNQNIEQIDNENESIAKISCNV